MSRELQSIKLRPGMRFALRDVIHEIANVDPHQIRYSACDGGRPARMPTEVFWSLVDDETIGMLEGAESAAENAGQLWQHAEHEVAEMHRRHAYVRAALANGRKPTSRQKIQAVILVVATQSGDASAPSRSALARWIKAFAESNGSIKSLLPKHSRKGRHPYKFGMAIEMLIQEKLVSDYLTANRNPLEQVRCNIVKASQGNPILKGEAVPSKSTFYRRAAQLDHYVVTMKRYGKRIADTKHSAAGSGLLAIRPMQYVMIDGHRMDVLAIDPATGAVIGRPFLTCLFDVLTRCVVGWHISMMPFSATTAMAAIKHMCSRDPSIGPGGVPETLIPDNGPDLASAAMRNLCRHVHLTISPAKKYSPNDKAHLERFFRTVNNMFSHRLPGTTFSSPSDRKDYASEKYACMTIDDVRELFEQQFLNTYHTKEHSGIKRVPILAWRDAQPSFPIPHFPLEELEVIARVPFNRTINQGRVLVEGLYYKSNALRALELRGKADVTVMLDELNLSFVYVHDPLDHKVVYRADAILGDYAKDLTMYEHKEVRARMKKLAEEDRQRLGEYAYEYARCDLWDAIQERKYEANKLKRARLKALVSDAKVKAVRVEVVDTPSIPHIAPSRAPEHPTLPGLRTWFGGDSCTNQTFEG